AWAAGFQRFVLSQAHRPKNSLDGETLTQGRRSSCFGDLMAFDFRVGLGMFGAEERTFSTGEFLMTNPLISSNRAASTPGAISVLMLSMSRPSTSTHVIAGRKSSL